MNLNEARQILKKRGYVMLKEREYTNAESDELMTGLRSLKNEYEKKGYTVALRPAAIIDYYVDLGYDPTIGCNYSSRRSRRGIYTRLDMFKKDSIENISKDGKELPGIFELEIWKKPSEEYQKYAEKKRGWTDEFRFYMGVGFELINDEDETTELKWKIGNKFYTGSVSDFINAVNADVAEQEQKCKKANYEKYKDMIDFHKRIDARDAKKKRKYNARQKMIENIGALLGDDKTFKKNFIMLYNNQPEALREFMYHELAEILDEAIYDAIGDCYVYNSVWNPDEDGYEYITDIVDDIYNNYNDDPEEFFNEFDIDNYNSLIEFCKESDYINTWQAVNYYENYDPD